MEIAAILIGLVLGVGMAINGIRKRRDRREANAYLARKAREERQQQH